MANFISSKIDRHLILFLKKIMPNGDSITEVIKLQYPWYIIIPLNVSAPFQWHYGIRDIDFSNLLSIMAINLTSLNVLWILIKYNVTIGSRAFLLRQINDHLVLKSIHTFWVILIAWLCFFLNFPRLTRIIILFFES